MHDLGQQDLKDVQHEHIYELSIDGRSLAGRPLKTQKPQSRQEDMAAKFEERITSYVESQLEAAFAKKAPGSPPELSPKVPAKLAFGGVAIGVGSLLILAVVLIAIAFLIKTVFLSRSSARVADERRVAAEADRLVERARLVADAIDDRLPAALLVEATERERADGGAEAASPELLSTPTGSSSPTRFSSSGQIRQ